MATAEGIDNITPGVALPIVEVLQDSAGEPVATGTTSLAIYEVRDDGSLYSFDWSDNTFRATSLTTETASLTHRTGNGGATDTGVWTYVLSTTQLAGFTEGRKYLIRVTNSGASPPTLVRMFGYGEAPQADAVKVAGSATAATNLKQSALAIATGTVEADGSNTATTFKVDSTLGAKAANYFGSGDGGMVLVFVAGTANEWQGRRVVSFNTTTDFITVEEAFASEPADGDAFVLLGRITELA